MNEIDERPALTNLAMIRGTVPNDAQSRDLPGGGVVVQFDVATRIVAGDRETSVSVPVAWNDPTAAQLATIIAGAEVVVIGTVRRRFFRVGGATQSRTEVIADTVIPTRRAKQVSGALRDAADRLSARIV